MNKKTERESEVFISIFKKSENQDWSISEVPPAPVALSSSLDTLSLSSWRRGLGLDPGGATTGPREGEAVPK